MNGSVYNIFVINKMFDVQMFKCTVKGIKVPFAFNHLFTEIDHNDWLFFSHRAKKMP